MRQLTKSILGLAMLLLSSAAMAQTSVQQAASRSDVTTGVAVSTNFNTVNTQGVATVSVQAGLYAYVTAISLEQCGNATGTAATNVLFTSTGISGTPSWQYSATTANSLSTCTRQFESFTIPLKSASAGTNVVITSPSALTNTAFGIRIYYYLAP